MDMTGFDGLGLADVEKGIEIIEYVLYYLPRATGSEWLSVPLNTNDTSSLF